MSSIQNSSTQLCFPNLQKCLRAHRSTLSQLCCKTKFIRKSRSTLSQLCCKPSSFERAGQPFCSSAATPCSFEHAGQPFLSPVANQSPTLSQLCCKPNSSKHAGQPFLNSFANQVHFERSSKHAGQPLLNSFANQKFNPCSTLLQAKFSGSRRSAEVFEIFVRLMKVNCRNPWSNCGAIDTSSTTFFLDPHRGLG